MNPKHKQEKFQTSTNSNKNVLCKRQVYHEIYFTIAKIKVYSNLTYDVVSMPNNDLTDIVPPVMILWLSKCFLTNLIEFQKQKSKQLHAHMLWWVICLASNLVLSILKFY